MIKSAPALATVLALSFGALSAPQAIAKGGQDAYERQQEIQAEFEKARQNKQPDSGISLFDQLFGSQPDDTKAKSKDKASDTTTE